MLYERLLQTAASRPDRLAVDDGSMPLTFKQLAGAAGALAGFLAKASPDADAPVGVLLPTASAYAAAIHAIGAAGRVALPLNYLLAPAELVRVVKHSGAKLILASKHFEKLADVLDAEIVYAEDLAGDLAAAAASGQVQRPAAPRDPQDTAVLLYTSGSSGAPKGVMLSGEALAANVDGCIEHLDMKPDHNFLGVLPLFHTFGLTAMLFVPNLLGSTVHYRPRFVPRSVVGDIAERSVSVFMAVPSMYGAMMSVKDAGAGDLASLKLAIAGGEPLPGPLADAFAARFDTPILQGYGLTETAPVVAINRPHDDRPGTVGRPLPNVKVKIVDESGAPCGPNEPGEITVFGPSVMQGYYRDPDATSAAMTADGGLRTGDVGTLDADGYLAIRGRIKEMIIVAGENVFPAEVEQVLDAHPAVARSAVIGVAEGNRGEQIVAFVTPAEGADAPTENELRSFCREHLAGFKVPRRVIAIDELPTSASGKVLRKELHGRVN